MVTHHAVNRVRGLLWLTAVVTVSLAIIITGARVLLPHLDHYRQPIVQWVSTHTHTTLTAQHISGQWTLSGPEITLQDIHLADPASSTPWGHIERATVSFDLWRSLYTLRPVFKTLRLHRAEIDTTRLSSPTPTSDRSVTARLASLFFTQWGDVYLTDASVWVMTPSGQRHQLDIASLHWVNVQGHHLAEATFQLANNPVGALSVQVNMQEQGTLSTLQGTVYVKGERLSVSPWLKQQLAGVANITQSAVNMQAWVAIRQGKLASATLRLDDSYIDWTRGKTAHQLAIKQGMVRFSPLSAMHNGRQAWQLQTDGFSMTTDNVQWPTLDLAAQLTLNNQLGVERWRATVSHIALQRLLPLVNFLPANHAVTTALKQAQPTGMISDIRVAGETGQSPHFSFDVNALTFKPWQQFPGMQQLHATVAGSVAEGHVSLRLEDGRLPYSSVFPKPLVIDDAALDLYWRHDAQETTLWSDHFTIATPDVRTRGMFRLDAKKDQPLWLAFFAEASVNDVGQVWRYLPRPALGNKLTDYLSNALQGGKVKDAKLLWYGALNRFPYHDHDGIFQVDVPLTHGIFQFDPRWPLLRDLQLDLGFKNNTMHLRSDQVKTLAATGSALTGDARLAKQGRLALTMDIAATGQAVSDYMAQSPLKNSVGKALTQVVVKGPLNAQLQLDIPFNGGKVNAKGAVLLNGNTVNLQHPAIALTKATGRLTFDNEKIMLDSLSGHWLGQPIQLNVTGDRAPNKAGYKVNVDVAGRWQLAPLQAYLPTLLQGKLSGYSRWQSHIGVELSATGSQYQISGTVPLTAIESQLPRPLRFNTADDRPTTAALTIALKGDSQQLYGHVQLPNMRYQARLDLTSPQPTIRASALTVGAQPALTALPLSGNSIQIALTTLDADPWLRLFNASDTSIARSSSAKDTFAVGFPRPDNVAVTIPHLTLGGLVWHDVEARAIKDPQWTLQLASREANGTVTQERDGQIAAHFTSLHLTLPTTLVATAPTSYREGEETTVTSVDRTVMQSIPAMDVSVADMWLQGYRLGQLSARVSKSPQRLQLDNFTLRSKDISLKAKGAWQITADRNDTEVTIDFQGEKSADVFTTFTALPA